MSIKEIQEKGNISGFFGGWWPVSLVVVLFIVLGYGIGRLALLQRATAPVVLSQAPQGAGLYVASRTGTKYHLPWCSGAERIKDENRIWFSSEEAARKAGFVPAANCAGLLRERSL